MPATATAAVRVTKHSAAPTIPMRQTAPLFDFSVPRKTNGTERGLDWEETRKGKPRTAVSVQGTVAPSTPDPLPLQGAR